MTRYTTWTSQLWRLMILPLLHDVYPMRVSWFKVQTPIGRQFFSFSAAKLNFSLITTCHFYIPNFKNSTHITPKLAIWRTKDFLNMGRRKSPSIDPPFSVRAQSHIWKSCVRCDVRWSVFSELMNMAEDCQSSASDPTTQPVWLGTEMLLMSMLPRGLKGLVRGTSSLFLESLGLVLTG